SFTEAPEEAVERVRREQLEGAVEALEQDGDVHDARKRLKKTRALLRLVRPALEPDAFRAPNVAPRDTGRAPSRAPDAEALVEAVEELSGRSPRRAPFAHVRDELERRRTAEDPPAGAAARLRALAEDDWPLDGLDAETFPRALKRTYARGRQAF